MKCPHCNSHMLVHNETENGRSKVTFYRCTVCVGEHITSTVNFVPSNVQKQPMIHFAGNDLAINL